MGTKRRMILYIVFLEYREAVQEMGWEAQPGSVMKHFVRQAVLKVKPQKKLEDQFS